jgi:hypothetical protein
MSPFSHGSALALAVAKIPSYEELTQTPLRG